jgi:hypothetical protein
MTHTTLFAEAKNVALRKMPRTSHPLTRGRQRGVSLIEGILYLVFALSVVIGGIVLFQSAQLSNRVTESARGLVAISSETRALHQNARSFGASGTDLNPALLNAGAVPSNFQDNAGTGIRHPWNGAVNVTAEDQEFTIELVGIPSDACSRISTVDARGQGVAGIGITSVQFGTNAPIVGEVTLTDASAGCGNQATQTVTFTYAR